MRLIERFIVCALIVGSALTVRAQDAALTIGSKAFTESYVLAEIMAQLLEARGIPVERRFGLGGTMFTYEALVAGEIDIYPEYSGTLTEVILKTRTANVASELADVGIEMLPGFGFDNTYALAVRRETAMSLGLATISDLRAHPGLRFGLSHEFRDRNDGWPQLRRAYELPQSSRGLEHGLAYQALAERSIDVTDAYSTDGELLRYDLVILRDDRQFFSQYLAMPLVRTAIAPQVKAALAELGGALDDDTMRSLNAMAVIERRDFAEVAQGFLLAAELNKPTVARADALWPSLARNTLKHLQLTGIALAAATVAGLSIALLVYRHARTARLALYLAGLIQTIPSIALLALLIPIVGIGQGPAIVALFCYSLLPIVRSAVTALLTIDPLLKKVSRALGLTQAEQLRHVYVPLALPHMLSGVRIAAVVSIGTATLAAFVGAGGLGEPIVTGLALNDPQLILQGAVPAAGLAIATELLFEALEHLLVPRHLISR
jgi:osmoprotectant transport system permease protein